MDGKGRVPLGGSGFVSQERAWVMLLWGFEQILLVTRLHCDLGRNSQDGKGVWFQLGGV